MLRADFEEPVRGLDPAQFVDLLAMVGDSSDNIPGVEGIGPKTAPKLLGECGNIEAASPARRKLNKSASSSAARARRRAPLRSLVKIGTALSDPTINEPALPIDALGLTGGAASDGGRSGRVPGGGVEISGATDGGEACYAASRRPV